MAPITLDCGKHAGHPADQASPAPALQHIHERQCLGAQQAYSNGLRRGVSAHNGRRFFRCLLLRFHGAERIIFMGEPGRMTPMVVYWSNHLKGSLFDPLKVVFWSPDLPRPGQRSCVFSPAFVQSNGQSHRRCSDRCLLLRLHAAAVLLFAGRPLTTRCLTVAAPRKCCSVTSPPCVALLALPFTDRPLFLRCLPMTYFTVQVMKWTRSRETSSPSHARR